MIKLNLIKVYGRNYMLEINLMNVLATKSHDKSESSLTTKSQYHEYHVTWKRGDPI